MRKKSPAFSLLAAILAYFALWLLVPRATFLPLIVKHLITSASHAGAAAFPLHVLALCIIALPTVAFMAIQIGIVYFFTKIKMNPLQSLLALLGFLAAAFLLMNLIVIQTGIPHKMGQYPGIRMQFFILSNVISGFKLPYYLMVMLAAVGLGYIISSRVKDKNLLLPVVMFAAFIDLWTVTVGPVATVLKKAPEVVGAVSTPIPHAGAGAFVPMTMIGSGDFIFMALVFAVVHRFSMRPRRNYWAIFAAMTIGMLVVMFGFLNALPALVVLAVAVIGANYREFKLSREEKISTAIVGVLLMASLPLMWFVIAPKLNKAHSHKPKLAVTAPASNAPKPNHKHLNTEPNLHRN
ncbi:MAG: hypothetical protein ABFD54_00265 [Armatimonadota bacterium]|nr:hypothetical protein [bacterium]